MEYKSDINVERAKLEKTVRIIEESLAEIIRERDEKTEQLRELIIRFSSATPEFYNDIPITQSLVLLYIKMAKDYAKAKSKPYFGKIVFDILPGGEPQLLYIGKYGIDDFMKSGIGSSVVIDWRAPVSELYYSTSFGKTSYDAPGGSISVDVHLKTSFDIQDGRILGLYDSDVMANDDLLIKYLSRNKDTVLTDIVATIQQDQNKIIRLEPYKNVIVQGVAGSGKTTVAVHRISYLLYNYKDILNTDNIYVIAFSRLFLNYMTAMLPDLDVPDIKQGTLPEFLCGFIREYDPKFRFSVTEAGKRASLGDTIAEMTRICTWFETYECAFYEKEGGVSVAGIEIISKESVLEYIQTHRRQKMLDRAEQLDKIITERIYKMKEVIIAHIAEHSKEAEIQEISREILKIDAPFIFEHDITKRFSRLAAKYKNFYQKKMKKLDYKVVYKELFGQSGQSVRELCRYALIVSEMRILDTMQSLRHIVIDEAQDFDVYVYNSLKTLFVNARFTLVGDVMQNISESGLQSWDDLRSFVFSGDVDFRTLSKSYRNTIEISDFARELVSRYSPEPLYIEPVIRHGREVMCYPVEDAVRVIPEILKAVSAEEYNICAIICRDEAGVDKYYRMLSGITEIKCLSHDAVALGSGNYIMPLKDSKGLEFDVVILPDFEDYDLTGSDLKRVYVAVTRALHELHVFCDFTKTNENSSQKAALQR